MDLDKIVISPRLRNGWEAIDLGVSLAREWWRILFLSWALPSLVCYLLLCALLIDKLWLAWTITWWLKPLWDRIPLYIASRLLFSGEVKLREVFKQLPSIFKTDLILALTIRRLSLTRSFDLPVTVLENLRGQVRRKRLNVLQLGNTDKAVWLTIVCFLMEMVVSFGFVAFAMWMVPQTMNVDLWDILESDAVAYEFLFNTLSFVSMTLIAPFYVLGGFALYINRRIDLEGWDIEIRFRKLEQRFEKLSSAGQG